MRLLFPLVLLFGVWLAERVVRRVRPDWLVPFAWLPIGETRRLRVHPERLGESRPTEEAPYREPAAGPPTVAGLGLPLEIRGSISSLLMRPDGRYAILRPSEAAEPFGWPNLVRIDLRMADGAVEARTRILPFSLVWFAVIFVAPLLVRVGPAFFGGLALLVGVFTGLRWLAARATLRARLDWAFEQLGQVLASPPEEKAPAVLS